LYREFEFLTSFRYSLESLFGLKNFSFSFDLTPGASDLYLNGVLRSKYDVRQVVEEENYGKIR